MHSELDETGASELQRVRHKVVDDLEQLHLVDEHLRFAARGQVEARSELDASCRRRGDVQVDGDPADVGDVDRGGRKAGRAVRELGVVEDAVEDAQQRLAGLASFVDQGAVLGAGVLTHHLQDLQNAVHRRAHLVAHVGEEAGLGGVGVFGGLLGALEFGGVDVAAEVFFCQYEEVPLPSLNSAPQKEAAGSDDRQLEDHTCQWGGARLCEEAEPDNGAADPSAHYGRSPASTHATEHKRHDSSQDERDIESSDDLADWFDLVAGIGGQACDRNEHEARTAK